MPQLAIVTLLLSLESSRRGCPTYRRKQI